MNKRQFRFATPARRGLRFFQASVAVGLTLASLGCGGGGGNDEVVASANQSSNAPAPPPSGPDMPVAVPKTFQFPNFSVDSKLTLVANFQTAGETPNLSGTAEAILSDLGSGPFAQLAARQAPNEDESEPIHPCGFADAYSFQELRGPSTINPQQAEIRPRFQELPEGAEEDFFLIPAFREVTAEKVLGPNETVHCTIFAEVIAGQPVVDRTKALAVAQAFDSNNPERPGSGIYDQVRAVFGSEWNQNPPGGNDGDEKIVIFFFSSQTLGSGLFGYMSPADSDPNGGNSSNMGEIIYVNGDKSLYQTLATISHEFQHVINQNQKVNQQGLNPPNAPTENVSLNEGLSGLSEEICGYDFESGNELLVAITNGYLTKPEKHEFFDFFQSGLGYGQSYLFLKYVREHFGDQTIRAISTDTKIGRESLDAHLPGGFAEIFRRWTVANYATNLTGQVPSIYRYPSGFKTKGDTPAGTLVGVKTFPMPNNQSTRSSLLQPWSATYLSLQSEPGTGLTATINPAGGSPYGLVFENIAETFTSFED